MIDRYLFEKLFAQVKQQLTLKIFICCTCFKEVYVYNKKIVYF